MTIAGYIAEMNSAAIYIVGKRNLVMPEVWYKARATVEDALKDAENLSVKSNIRSTKHIRLHPLSLHEG